MNRTRFVALFAAIAFMTTPVVTSAKVVEQLQVINTTQTRAWVTLYADFGPLGWTKLQSAGPGYSSHGQPWVYPRGWHDGNGPWKVRMEVTSPNGRRYDLFTTMWYDGSQHRFNNPGDPSTYLFVCEKASEFYWSFQSNCAGNANTAGI
jgi:hypothetical protein